MILATSFGITVGITKAFGATGCIRGLIAFGVTAAATGAGGGGGAAGGGGGGATSVIRSPR